MDLIYRLDPFAPLVPRAITTPEKAMQELQDGNKTFVSIAQRVRDHVHGTNEQLQHTPLVVPFDPITFGVSLVEGQPVQQTPFALVLGCSDARAPIEVILHRTCNDVFVVRVAGNVLGTECLGSIDYAVRKLGESLKLIVVLGHTSCGAVTTAVDMYLDPSDYADLGLTHALRSLVDRIMIAVRGAARALERAVGPNVIQAPGYRAALLEIAVYLNAALTAFDLKRELRLIGEDIDIEVAYGVFDLVSQHVCATPESSESFSIAPCLVEDFKQLGEDLVKSAVTRGVLYPTTE